MRLLLTLIGKEVNIFTRNKLRFEAKILYVDDDFVTIIDYKDSTRKYIYIEEISTIEEKKEGKKDEPSRSP